MILLYKVNQKSKIINSCKIDLLKDGGKECIISLELPIPSIGNLMIYATQIKDATKDIYGESKSMTIEAFTYEPDENYKNED